MQILEKIMNEKGYVYKSPNGGVEYKYSEFARDLSKHYRKYTHKKTDITKQRIHKALHLNAGESLELGFLYALYAFSGYESDKFMSLLKNELAQKGQ